MAADSQKFIARNRAPRVQIEYDVELYGTQKTVQLPFVMGVMSDLSGKSQVAQPDVEERKFLEIDADNFDDRMRGIAPRVAFAVPNTLTGEGNLEVDLTFEKMADFSPGAIAARVAHLRPLLEARTQLKTLMAYVDGKAGAEALLERILADPSLLSAIAASTGPATEADPEAALDALRAATPVAEQAPDPTAAVLTGLAAAAPTDLPAGDDTAETLSALGASAPEEAFIEDDTARALDSLSDVPTEMPAPDQTRDTLAALAASAPVDTPEEDATARALETLSDVNTDTLETDQTAETLSELAASAPVEKPEGDRSAEVLGTLSEVTPAASEPDTADETLAALAISAPEDAAEEDSSADVLAGLADTPQLDVPLDTTDATLAGLASAEPADVPPDETGARALESLPTTELAQPEPDRSADTLADLAAAAPEVVPEETDAAVLEGIARIEAPELEPDDTDESLAVLSSAKPSEAPPEDHAAKILAGVASPDLPEAEPDSSFLLPEILRGELAEGQEGQRPSRPHSFDDETLSELAASAPADATEEDPLADILGDLASSEDLSLAGDPFDHAITSLDRAPSEPNIPASAVPEGPGEPAAVAENEPGTGSPETDTGTSDALSGLDDLGLDIDLLANPLEAETEAEAQEPAPDLDNLDAILGEPVAEVPDDAPSDEGDGPAADTAQPETAPQDAGAEAADPLDDLDFDFDPDTLDALLTEPMPDVPEDDPRRRSPGRLVCGQGKGGGTGDSNDGRSAR